MATRSKLDTEVRENVGLDRIVEYVVSAFTNDVNNRGITYSTLLAETKKRAVREEYPLDMSETKKAISEAEKRGLIRKVNEDSYVLKR